VNNNWHNFLKNVGEWQGSFTQVSIDGNLGESVPSLLTLTALEDNKLVEFRIRRYGAGGYDSDPIVDRTQEYRTIGRPNIFFDNGAFSKGTIQLAPFAEFGAEYGFINGDRRWRCVQLFDRDNKFTSLTLIREFRAGSGAIEYPALTVDMLYGKWTGTATTIYSDLREPDTYNTSLEVNNLGDGNLEQNLTFGDRLITSVGKVVGNKILFDGDNPRQILLLPDGGSSNAPLTLPRQQAFFVEAGWLTALDRRERLIRSYSDRGEWISATHIIEHKQ
jgi:hypothetical protein